MNITYNALSDSENILTYSDIPNILKVEEEISGRKARLNFIFRGDLYATVTGDSQYYLTFNGATITNVMKPQSQANKTFYISSATTATANNFARALRNSPEISSEWNVIVSGSNAFLVAKTIGKKMEGYTYTRQFVDTNMGMEYLNINGSDGNAYSSLYGGKVNVDVYNAVSADSNNYITSLEKNYYGNECAFNVSPVLATFSSTENAEPYCLNLSLTTADGEYQDLGQVSGHTVEGYYSANSDKYKFLTGVVPLVNLNNDDAILYTYKNSVDYTVMVGSDTGGWTTVVNAKNSAGETLYTTNFTNHRMTGQYLYEKSITIPSQYWSATDRVEIQEGNTVITYNVIKPTKATEYCQRICWRNEYGGVSYFDFTGKKTVTTSVEKNTYKKNIFDYYETTPFREEKIYDINAKQTVSLTSHLMKEGGKYLFQSLAKAKDIWEDNGSDGDKYIIPSGVEVTESDTYNGIYTAKITYTYSTEQ